MQHTCKNCGNPYEGNYCNHCGQKAKVGKLTLRSVLDNWAYGLTNCDTGILFTYKELFTRPGHMLADYIHGKRIIYFQPFPMLFITAGLYGLLTEVLVPEALKENTITVTATLTFLERFLHLLSTWVHTSMSLLAIITLPLFAWAAQCTFRNPHYHPYTYNRRQFISSWVYYWLIHTKRNRLNTLSDYLFISTYRTRIKYLLTKKYGYNFTEYIFIFAYIACQRLVIGILIVIPLLLYTHSKELTGWYNASVYFIYFLFLFWDFKQLFSLSLWKTFRKTVFLLFNGCIIILLVTIVLTGLIIGIACIVAYFDKGYLEGVLNLLEDV